MKLNKNSGSSRNGRLEFHDRYEIYLPRSKASAKRAGPIQPKSPHHNVEH